MKRCNHEMLYDMFDAGKSRKEIAQKVGCREETVYKLLLEAGKIKKVYANRTKPEERKPILPGEIEQFKDSLQIGQMILLEAPNIREEFEEDGSRTRKRRIERCTIIAKYPYGLAAMNEKGQRRTAGYTELIVKERKKHDV